jgi:hypothetical protein
MMVEICPQNWLKYLSSFTWLVMHLFSMEKRTWLGIPRSSVQTRPFHDSDVHHVPSFSAVGDLK